MHFLDFENIWKNLLILEKSIYLIKVPVYNNLKLTNNNNGIIIRNMMRLMLFLDMLILI